jgi:GAF domain-containing protein
MTVAFDEESFVAAARAGDFRRVLEPKAQLREALLASPALREGEPRDALRQLDKIATRLLSVARVGIWVFDQEESKLTCLDLYATDPGVHTAGNTIVRVEARQYFELALRGEVIAVDDALADPRTSELARNYLPAFGVGALLDCPILIERHMAGVLRAEHVGGTRKWEGWERLLGSSLAECAGVAIAEARAASTGVWRQLAD